MASDKTTAYQGSVLGATVWDPNNFAVFAAPILSRYLWLNPGTGLCFNRRYGKPCRGKDCRCG